WISHNGKANEEPIQMPKNEANKQVKIAKNNTWNKPTSRIKKEKEEFTDIVRDIYVHIGEPASIREKYEIMNALEFPRLSHIISAGRQISHELSLKNIEHPRLIQWLRTKMNGLDQQISTKLYSSSELSPLKIPVVDPVYSE